MPVLIDVFQIRDKYFITKYEVKDNDKKHFDKYISSSVRYYIRGHGFQIYPNEYKKSNEDLQIFNSLRWAISELKQHVRNIRLINTYKNANGFVTRTYELMAE